MIGLRSIYFAVENGNSFAASHMELVARQLVDPQKREFIGTLAGAIPGCGLRIAMS